MRCGGVCARSADRGAGRGVRREGACHGLPAAARRESARPERPPIRRDREPVRPHGEPNRPDRDSIRRDRSSVRPDGEPNWPDRSLITPDRSSIRPDRSSIRPDRSSIRPDWSLIRPDRLSIWPDREPVWPGRQRRRPTRRAAGPIYGEGRPPPADCLATQPSPPVPPPALSRYKSCPPGRRAGAHAPRGGAFPGPVLTLRPPRPRARGPATDGMTFDGAMLPTETLYAR